MKSIIVLGATENQVPVIEKVQELGYAALVVDNNSANPGHLVATKSFLRSTTDIPFVLSLSQNYRIEAVIAHGSDPAALTASEVSYVLGLPGDNPHGVRLVQNKVNLRRLQAELGLPHPEFVQVFDPGDIRDFQSEQHGEVFIKPVDCSGSRGISVLKRNATEKEIFSAFEFAKQTSHLGQVIAEVSLPRAGNQMGGDIVFFDERVHHVFFTTQYMAIQGQSLAVGANLMPTTFEEDFRKDSLEQLISVIRNAGLKQGVYNFEFARGYKSEPVLVDFGARSGGGLYSHLSELSMGVSTVEVNIDLALGKTPRVIQEFDKVIPTLGITLHSPVSGVLSRIEKSKALEDLIQFEFLRTHPGTAVNAFQNSGDRLGMIIAGGANTDFESLLAIANNLESHINIVLD
jgi:biotin carboxylase